MVGANDMQKFAELVWALSALRKIRTLADVLFGAFDASLTVAKHSKVTANTITMPNMHMRVGTFCTHAVASIRKVHTQRRVMRV
jgi:hypothetical protein